MIKKAKLLIWKLFVKIDALLKFPNLRNGEIGIQLGFDMEYAITSDLFTMYRRVKPNGNVIGIDPDPRNVVAAQKIIDREKYKIKLIQKAVFSKKGECNLLLGKSTSWGQLNNVPIDSTVEFSNEKIYIKMDCLDNILNELSIDINKVGHINLTINGSEYEALKGMHNILTQVNDLNLTVVAGRYDESGTVKGRPDFEMIMEYLHKYGFETKFKRIHQLFWWGFITKTLLNRKWIYGKNNYGVIMATKGNKKMKRYQSFS